MGKPFILWLTLGLALSIAPASQGQEGEGGESPEPPKSAAELLREFRAEEVEKGKMPKALERLLIRPEDLPGYAPLAPLNGFWRKDRVLLGHSFYHVASEDRQNEQWKGRRILGIRYYLFDRREQALADWWMYPGRMQARFVVPRGTSSGEPLGVELCWRGGGIPDGDTPAAWGYGLYILWKDNLVGEVDIRGVGTLMKHPVTKEEIHLVENVARKVLANLEGIPFEVTTKPPKDWIFKPVRLLVRGQPLTVPRKRYTSGWRHPLGGGPARPNLECEMTPPNPVLWRGHVLVAPSVLEALGLQVKTEEGDPWREAKDDRGDYMEWIGPTGPTRFAEWAHTLKRIVVSRDEQKMTFTLGEREATMADGTTQPLEGAPRMLDGFPVVPLEAVTAAFGLAVEVERPPVGRSCDGKRDGNTPANPPPSRGSGGASPQGSPLARPSYWAWGAGAVGLVVLGLGWLAWRRGRRGEETLDPPARPA